MKINISILFAVLLSLAFNVSASDLAKEKRWADQVVDAILDGDAVWLNDGKSDFLGIYTEAEEDKGRAVIVMHGTGIHPDWAQVVQPLRVGLTEHDWNTLSIQMPILHNEAEYHEYVPLYPEVPARIEAAIAFLKENGAKEIMLLGHSQGAAMTAYYLARNKTEAKGFVSIGMGPFDGKDVTNTNKALEKITLPVFDLYGDEDLEEILANVDARAAAARKAGNKNYTQKKISGNHFFDGQEDALVETVADWLEKNSGR